MKKLKILISLIALAQISCYVFAAPPQALKLEENTKHKLQQQTIQQPLKPKKVLKGSVTQIQELPRGFYGMWEVHGLLLETNEPTMYAERSNDIWILQKNGEYVTLINPKSGATATITITEVQNNTATFVRKTQTRSYSDSEQVTLTLQNDNFFGTDIIISQNSMGIITTARYKINGAKISGESFYKPIRYLELQSKFSY